MAEFPIMVATGQLNPPPDDPHKPMSACYLEAPADFRILATTLRFPSEAYTANSPA
jgi:hypothetical protein